MRIVFMGTPDFAVASLDALYKAGFEIAAAVSQPDKPKGRHAQAAPTAVKKRAEELGIPVLQPEKASDPEFLNKIRELQPDVIVVAAYGKILKKELLDIPRYGCINVHGSILPRWRGAAPIQWAVLEGDEEAGVTTMLMNEGLDTGDMLMMSKVKLSPDETAGSLFDKLAYLGGELIVETINEMYDGLLLPVPQPEEGVNYAPMLKKEMGLIDWSQTAESIDRLIRGLYPWPGAYSYSDGRLIKIHKAFIAEPSQDNAADNAALSTAGGCAGDVQTENGRIFVSCGSGRLELVELQAEGKKRMSAADFLRGNTIAHLGAKEG